MHVESKYKAKKADKKQRRCLSIIENDCNIKASETATIYLAVLNAGLSNGLSEEKLLANATIHGQLTSIVMLPDKSYCFLQAATIEDAEHIFNGMHNSAHIGQNDAVAYLSYVAQLPVTAENVWLKPLPPGLFILEDFVTSDEEISLLNAVNLEKSQTDSELKHRKVKHFGYEFLYGINNVDTTAPLEQKIPSECDVLWQRLKTTAWQMKIPALDWHEPDQLTVNEYQPGHGIPAHVDTHSAFLDPILSLSLEDDIVMDFRRGTERVPVVLPRRSLLIMSGEARYDWTHGITPKNYDIVPTPADTLTTKQRKQRTSLTFRRLRRAPCDCAYPTLCDSRTSATATKTTTNDVAKTLAKEAVAIETQNVHNIYDKIANHFSETRHTPWPQVVDFLNSFETQSVVLDVGCGNGKYLNCNAKEILAIGCDRSKGLLDVCNSRGNNVFRCDCLQLPIRDACIDGCISIAVIHHLATPERRLTAVREMLRVLRPGGRALIYVWAKEQKCNKTKSSYLLQNKAVNKQRITEQEQRQRTAQELEQQQLEANVKLPIHTNRTEFQAQDVLVPWKTKDEQKTTFLRYYHVFEANELETIVKSLPNSELVRSYYDQGNHCIIFRRK